MYVDSTIKDQSIPGVITKSATSPKEKVEEDKTKPQTSDGNFEQVLTRMLTPNGQNEVSEEELFAGILGERITKLKGDEAGVAFSEKLAASKESLKRHDGFVSVEEAARAAMKELVADGTLTESEASGMHAQAFKAAQLDDNHEALFDNRGGPGDPTIAVSQLEAALLSARTIIEKIDSGEDTIGELGLSVGNTGLPNVKVTTLDDGTLSSSTITDATDVEKGNPQDGPEGFLFKPISESNGNLVVLMPHRLKEQIESVLLRDLDGNEIETGKSTGYANGDREHFRFSKPGGEYGSDITVEAKFKDGSVEQFSIPNPSERYD